MKVFTKCKCDIHPSFEKYTSPNLFFSYASDSFDLSTIILSIILEDTFRYISFSMFFKT